MSAEYLAEENEIAKGDEILEEIAKEKSKFLQSEWAINFFTNINYMKSVHSAEMDEKDKTIKANLEELQAKDEELQAMKEVQVETVKLLYKSGVSLEEIAKSTKLSISDIENIINA